MNDNSHPLAGDTMHVLNQKPPIPRHDESRTKRLWEPFQQVRSEEQLSIHEAHLSRVGSSHLGSTCSRYLRGGALKKGPSRVIYIPHIFVSSRYGSLVYEEKDHRRTNCPVFVLPLGAPSIVGGEEPRTRVNLKTSHWYSPASCLSLVAISPTKTTPNGPNPLSCCSLQPATQHATAAHSTAVVASPAALYAQWSCRSKKKSDGWSLSSSQRASTPANSGPICTQRFRMCVFLEGGGLDARGRWRG